MRTLVLDTLTKTNQEVTLSGWVNTVRSHGGIVFLDLRDRTGIVQVVAKKSQAHGIGAEDVVEIKGMVKSRPENLVNPKIPTGHVEIEARDILVLSRSAELPLPIDTDGYAIDEEVRLKYRYLDLRRPRLTRNIRLRSQFIEEVRQFLFKNDFCEIETPMLTKSTPEGSRDFLVPSRMQPGKFYALPQSPQQYKQLLMVAGFERYFQIARCMRDEDLRADRGFEHSQVDIEMSFVEQKDVMNLVEELAINIIETLGGKILKKPFPVIFYDEAMKKYGADKFDMRTQKEKESGVHAFAWVVDFPFFERDKEGNWTFTHNPFSDVKTEQKTAFLTGQIEGIKTTQYDLVWNGFEAGGGSIRSTDPAILHKVFEVLGYSSEQIESQFGHILKAFSFGVPPHGGIALGIERWMMGLTHETSIKEVQAFPMTSGGQTSVMDAPSEVTEKQLREVGLALRSKKLAGDVYSQIISLFKEEKVDYKTYEHKPVFTSEDSAKVRGTTLHQGAKALVMVGDDMPLMVVVPADMKVDTKKLKTALKIKDLRMATREEVKQFTTVEVGAVPPFGNLFSMPLYLDESMRDNEVIVFNAGSHTKSISIKETDFEKVTQAKVGDFSLKP